MAATRNLNRTNLVSSAVFVAGLTLVAKAVSAGKELVVAYKFGASAELGAYLFAYMFPAFLTNVLSATLGVVLIPKYLVARNSRGEAAASAMILRVSGTTLWGLAIGVALVTPLFLFLIRPLARGFRQEDIDLCSRITLLLMPSAILTGASSLWSAVINANGDYRFTSLVPIVTPVAVTLALWLTGSAGGVYWMVMATIVGLSLEAALTGWRASLLGCPVFRIVRPRMAEDWDIYTLFVPTALASILMAGSMLIEQSFAASVSSHEVAAYAFGTRLTSVAAGVLVTTLSTVLLPHFSSVLAIRGIGQLRAEVVPIVLIILCVSIPVSCGFYFGSHAITALTFERGNFNSEDADLVARIQAVHALYIPIFAVGMTAVRILNSLSASTTILVGSTLNLIASFVLNWMLVPGLGAVGIAWSNVGMYFVAATYLWIFAVRRMKRVGS